jgi:prepilin-type N-terminal cleavage/methylation domain-containing protein
MIARLRGRLVESGGYSLSEMIVVMAILGIVLAALVQLFVSASHAQVDMNNRFQAQQNARLALDGLRREIHCASAVTSTTSSITVTLGVYCHGPWAANTAYTVGQVVRPTDPNSNPYLFTVTAVTGTGTSAASEPNWPSTLSATVSNGTVTFKNVGPTASYTWCVTDRSGGTPPGVGAPYTLWRYTGSLCSGTTGHQWATNLIMPPLGGPVFAYTGSTTGNLGYISVDLAVDLTPNDTRQRYELTDNIVLRNTTRQ